MVRRSLPRVISFDCSQINSCSRVGVSVWPLDSDSMILHQLWDLFAQDGQAYLDKIPPQIGYQIRVVCEDPFIIERIEAFQFFTHLSSICVPKFIDRSAVSKRGIWPLSGYGSLYLRKWIEYSRLKLVYEKNPGRIAVVANVSANSSANNQYFYWTFFLLKR